MRFSRARRRVVTGLAVLALGSACAGPGARPDGADPDGEFGPTAPGAALAWSRPADPGTWPVAMIGDTMLLVDGQNLLGLRRGDGVEKWRIPFGDHDRFTAAGSHVVVERSRAGSFVPTEVTESKRLEVFDAATGAARWSAAGPLRAVVRTDAVYLVQRSDPTAEPAVTAYAIDDGRPRWTTPGVGVTNDTVGTRLPYAPQATRYLTATGRGGTVSALDTRTGALQRGQLDRRTWWAMVADQTLVVTDNDPPPGDSRCTVAVAAVGVDGTNQHTITAFSGRQADDTCQRRLARTENGQAVLGAGTRIAVSSADGRPQALDLATGAVAWTAAAPGVPIDGDGTQLLVRRHSDVGDLALLDLAGGRPRWTTPDPGLPGTSASWNSAVTSRLVAVASTPDGHRPLVNVYDADTGRLRGRFPSWLAGAGDNWVVVTHSRDRLDEKGQSVELWTF